MSTTKSPRFFVLQAPSRSAIDTPSIILYGSIEGNVKVTWQSSLASSLSDLPITILDPRRDDWDSTWVEDIKFPKFKEQVDWEMDHAKVADIIVYHFVPGTPAAITLLELGMYAGTGKAIVCCPPGYAKRGNVQIVCSRYGIPLVETLPALEGKIRERLAERFGDS
ncbi:hypothetical protein BU24DRAFT_420435 [Aaosphaeria arxii CBS 175.79]|uniref:Uncharacterized protein n=1 Tax=Aaosphaeria arxii CBS 175.79 TaxID=1450172 RepID=A0A6A5XVP4_9PLEO|nr:uncharacterized protein BU24DRAFT_420435 [Aaosphaeria arxii CBS 175.79]KAF2017385.1 hypothetical protein BU24DRAFT_420435 [Aaosphaeria arxii CBS 175.79]